MLDQLESKMDKFLDSDEVKELLADVERTKRELERHMTEANGST
jgi:HAMP domain-containing protein